MTNIIPVVTAIETEIIISFTVTNQKRPLIPESIREYSSHYWIYLALLIRGKDPEKYGFEKKKILKKSVEKVTSTEVTKTRKKTMVSMTIEPVCPNIDRLLPYRALSTTPMEMNSRQFDEFVEFCAVVEAHLRIIPRNLKFCLSRILSDNFEVETNTHNVIKAVHDKWNVVSIMKLRV